MMSAEQAAETILSNACHLSGFTRQQFTGKQISRPLVEWRHVTIAAIHKATGLSTPAIGRLMNRDHTTILNALRTGARLIRRDEFFHRAYSEMLEFVDGGVWSECP